MRKIVKWSTHLHCTGTEIGWDEPNNLKCSWRQPHKNFGLPGQYFFVLVGECVWRGGGIMFFGLYLTTSYEHQVDGWLTEYKCK